ncbi:MAG TPA: hypothetical protein VMZ69_02630 [Saprospiraceae bacterium]|nr:hypothetical protein [Saprospiraceae bacterium]
MKNLFILLLAILGLTSCSKDSLEPLVDNELSPRQSEIMVRASYLTFTDQCITECGGQNKDIVTFIEDADVNLYAGENSATDASLIPILKMQTNSDGAAIIKDVEPGTYTVIIETELGTKSRTLTTQLHKRSFIDFSF